MKMSMTKLYATRGSPAFLCHYREKMHTSLSDDTGDQTRRGRQRG